jgi:hypothetical protein
MCVTVQDNIDIFRRSLGRNVLKTKLQSTADKIDNQRPLVIAIAISAHDRDRRPNRAKLIQNAFRANVPKVPNLIGISRKIDNILRQFVMRVGENENRYHVERSRAISCRFKPRMILAQRTQRSQSQHFKYPP